MKVVELGDKHKPAEACPFCGAVPICPGWTCKRLAAVTIDPDGGYTVEFIDPRDDEPDAAA